MSAYSASGSGHRQDDRGQREEADLEVGGDEVQRLPRRQRAQDRRLEHDALDPEARDHREPDHHHRAEQPPDDRGPAPLHSEQADDDRDRDRDDGV
jgi:hypothetical protein